MRPRFRLKVSIQLRSMVMMMLSLHLPGTSSYAVATKSLPVSRLILASAHCSCRVSRKIQVIRTSVAILKSSGNITSYVVVSQKYASIISKALLQLLADHAWLRDDRANSMEGINSQVCHHQLRHFACPCHLLRYRQWVMHASTQALQQF
jgi:hypothetical protein